MVLFMDLTGILYSSYLEIKIVGDIAYAIGAVPVKHPINAAMKSGLETFQATVE